MVWACHMSQQPLQNHPSGLLRGLVPPWSAGQHRKRLVFNIKEWTSLSMPELLTMACRKDWKRMTAESSVISSWWPCRLFMGLNWMILPRPVLIQKNYYRSVPSFQGWQIVQRKWSYKTKFFFANNHPGRLRQKHGLLHHQVKNHWILVLWVHWSRNWKIHQL